MEKPYIWCRSVLSRETVFLHRLHMPMETRYFKAQSLLVSNPCPGMQPSSLSKRHCQLYLLKVLLPSCHLPSRALCLTLRTLNTLSPNYLPTWACTIQSRFALNGLLADTYDVWHFSSKKQSLTHCHLWLMGKHIWGIQRPGLVSAVMCFVSNIGLPEKIQHRGHTYPKNYLLLI